MESASRACVETEVCYKVGGVDEGLLVGTFEKDEYH